MPARMDIVGFVLRPGAGRAGCHRQATERDLPLRMDGERELLLAQRERRPMTLSRRPARKPKTAAKPKAWHVSIMRARAHYLGIVYAPDQQAAEVAAVAEFKIDPQQRRRLVVRGDE